jgi:hypothetical protein
MTKLDSRCLAFGEISFGRGHVLHFSVPRPLCRRATPPTSAGLTGSPIFVILLFVVGRRDNRRHARAENILRFRSQREECRMNNQAHVEMLVEKHARLENEIYEESHRPAPDQVLISDLKRQKLRIKDEIARLQNPSA